MSDTASSPPSDCLDEQLIPDSHIVIRLSRRASLTFVTALLDPPQSSERLRAAAREYKKFIGEDPFS